MPSFADARDALHAALLRIYPDAKPAPRWAGVEAWAAPRPEGAIAHASTGTYDPKVIVVGIADRKSGPVVYFLDPGDYFALETHRALLEDAGLKVGRGCIYHTRKAPLPVDALEELLRRTKARDAKAAKPTGKKAAAKKAGAKKAAKSPRMRAASSVAEYLAALPGEQRMALERLRKLVLAAAPEAGEKIGYGIPTFTYAGRNLVHMAAFKDHCSFYPGSGGVTLALHRKLEKYETAKGTIRFAPNKPLPATLVKEIVKLRVAEIDAAKKPTRARARAARTPGTRARRSP